MSKEKENKEEELTSSAQSETEDSQAGDSSVVLSKEEFEQLNQRLQELESLRDKLMRSAADYENAKKRLSRERDEFTKFGQESLLKSLLPVLDNFERAISHAGPSKDGGEAGGKQFQSIISGIQMVYKQFVDILKSQGLVRISSLGQTFDPHKHEALAYVPQEGKEEEIIAEIEPGYMLHDRLLRAAKVNVRTAPVQASQSKEAAEGKE